MFHYLFSNDMRISDLEEKTAVFANQFLSDNIASYDKDKSENNNANTVGYYLNLANKGTCARVAASGNVKEVIMNFIKTFQYPNPRSKQSLYDCINDNIRIAPLREIIKILFLAKQIKEDEAFLTTEEVLNFIFYNNEVAKVEEVDRKKVLEDIFEYRKTTVLPDNVAPDNERFWNQEKRQIKELIDVIKWSNFITFEDGVIELKEPEYEDFKQKADFYDILMYEKFWIPDNSKSLSENRKSYAEYCDEQLNTNLSLKNYWDYSKITCNKLDNTIQKLYFGAPGTGKSYEITKVIKKVYPSIDEKENPFVFKTTVYSDYSYYDFIGNLVPAKKDGTIEYEFKPGIFTQALNMAYMCYDKDIFLVVEEMSRGDIASIFGDIFQLLDRDVNGVSEYSINNDSISYWLEKNGIDLKKIYLPSNLHILGTVNTSDQNVNVIDTAFKRRFDFIYVSVDPSTKEGSDELLNEFVFELNDGDNTLKFEWNKLYMALNKFIIKELELSEDKQLGQFFIKFGNYKTEDAKFNAIKNKVLHYLWDDVQSASLNDNVSIFLSDITTFSELYKEFSDKKLVFSEEFLKYYK